MKLAIAGDSAGEGLAKVLADHLKDRFEVHEVSRTNGGADPFYANKLVVGRYYIERILPEAPARLAKIKAGSGAMMALPAEAF